MQKNSPSEDPSGINSTKSTKCNLSLAINLDNAQPSSPNSVIEPAGTCSDSMENVVSSDPFIEVKYAEETNSNSERDYLYSDEEHILNLETISSSQEKLPEDDAMVKIVVRANKDVEKIELENAHEFYQPRKSTATNVELDENSEAEIKFLPEGESHPKCCFLPALPLDQFRVHLRQDEKHLVQTISLRNKQFTLQYALLDNNAVTSISSATCNSTVTIPMNISLLHEIQDKTMTYTYQQIAKAINEVNIVIQAMIELISQVQVGKYSKILDSNVKEIKVKFRNKIKEMNVYAGIIYQIAKELTEAIVKFRSGIYKAIESNVDEDEEKPTFYEFNRAFTKQAVEGILRVEEPLREIQLAFQQINSTMQIGEESLASFSLKNSEIIGLKPKHVKNIKTLLNGIRQIQSGANQAMNFEAILMSIVTDTITIKNLKYLEHLNDMDSSVYKRKYLKLVKLYEMFDLFVRYSRKLELLSSYLAYKSMNGLRRFSITKNKKTFKPLWSRRHIFDYDQYQEHEIPKSEEQQQKVSKKTVRFQEERKEVIGPSESSDR